mgnify:CR=1 FL=1
MLSNVCKHHLKLFKIYFWRGRKNKKIEQQNEGCIIVGVAQSGISEEIALEHLDELEFLATTAGAVTKKHFLQKKLTWK